MRQRHQAGARPASDAAPFVTPSAAGKQTRVGAELGAAPAGPAPAGAGPQIRRQEDLAADPAAALDELAADIEIVRRNVDPDGAGADGVTAPTRYTNRLRRLGERLEEVRLVIAASDDAALLDAYALVQDALVAAYQTLAVYHGDQTLQAWAGASEDDRAAQRDQYQRESGMGGSSTADWCGMFANAQYRDAGMHGALSMAFNSTFHVEEFFTYGTGSPNSPAAIAPHGAEPRRGVQEYHQERGSVRSWLSRDAIGDDLRPGDIVTLDWVGPNDANDDNTRLRERVDHVSTVRSYTPASGDAPGVLVTIDGNAFGARKPGAAQPAWGSLGAGDYSERGDGAEQTYASTSRYEREAESGGPTGEQNDGPAFDRGGMLGTQDAYREMTLWGRGRPSLVDFEPDHVYYNQVTPDAGTDRQYSDRGRPGGPIQRLESGAVTAADPGAAFDAAASGGAGELPYRDEMQRAFRADFSGVRAYLGRDLRSLGALAATRGDHVLFASATPDRETVAHELTHVLQARGGRAGGSAAVSDPGDASEHEARRTAATIAAGGAGPAADAAGGGAVAPAAQIQCQEDPARPPAVHPPAGSTGGHWIDWDNFLGLPPTLANGQRVDSIREVYEFALLRQLVAHLPELCAGHEIPSEEGGRSASPARRAAVAALIDAIRAHTEGLLRDGDQAGAEAVRVRLFTAQQYAIVDTLNVQSAGRYAPTDTDTFCNVYAYDVVTAMGGYLPRVWWTERGFEALETGARLVDRAEYDRLGGVGVVHNDLPFAAQVNANQLTQWMRDWGVPAFGWSALESARAAQDAANAGQIVVILARHGDPEQSGHVSVVLAESAQHRAPTETTDGAYVPLQSQAGATNFSYNDTDAAVASAGRRAWWEESIYEDAGFFAYTGELDSSHAIARPDALGTALPEVTEESEEEGEDEGAEGTGGTGGTGGPH